MGLLNFFRNEFVEVIDWVETDSNIIMWKFPDKEADIKYGAQLTVRESQSALFLDEGEVADIFPPGRYTLDTQNLPVLTKLRNWDKFFTSPFKSDIYFISHRVLTNLKWGTTNPIMLRDPQFQQVRVKAFGVYFIKIQDPVKFFKNFAGTKTTQTVQEIEEAMRDIVAPKFAEAIAEANVAVMDMVANLSELNQKIQPLLQDDFANFGLELVKFQITSVSMPPEVEAFYDKMTNMHMVKDMQKFSQFQTAVSIEKASENEGGTAGTGVGMGIGVGMAQVMNQSMQTSNNPDNKESILAMIRELGKLKEEGLLTEEEFASKKEELLKRI